MFPFNQHSLFERIKIFNLKLDNSDQNNINNKK